MKTLTIHRKSGNIIIETDDADDEAKVLKEHGITTYTKITVNYGNAKNPLPLPAASAHTAHKAGNRL